jgi:Domain of unknown function (DUF4148)
MLVAAAAIATNAQAQEKTRAQVRQELIEAERNGLNFITDTSYPAVNPMFEQQVARLKQQNSDGGTGGAMTGVSDAGNVKQDRPPAVPASCVGPVTFCNLYFGS